MTDPLLGMASYTFLKSFKLSLSLFEDNNYGVDSSGQASVPPIRKPKASLCTNFSHKGSRHQKQERINPIACKKETTQNNKIKRQRIMTQIKEQEKKKQKNS